MGVVLNKATVERIAALYDADYDRQVFPLDYLARSHLTGEELAATGYGYPRRSHLTIDELQRMMDWKYPRGRTRKLAEQNCAERTKMVTSNAFAMTDSVGAVRELCQLKSVWVRLASAILTVFDPLHFTVLDVRAWTALNGLGLLDQLKLSHLGDRLDYPETYGTYLQGCVRLADEAQVSLRSLD